MLDGKIIISGITVLHFVNALDMPFLEVNTCLVAVLWARKFFINNSNDIAIIIAVMSIFIVFVCDKHETIYLYELHL